MNVIIVCHTEFGFVVGLPAQAGRKVIFDKKGVAGVTAGVLNLIRVAKKYGAKVSFAVCPEVAEYFPKNSGHEVGLHVHPGWQELSEGNHRFMVGDEYLKQHCQQSSTSTFLHEYPYEEQLDMISKGKAHIKEVLGADAKFFVAGRWSFNQDTVKALIETGFTHDCSDSSQAPISNFKFQISNLIRIPTSRYFPNGDVNPEHIPRVGLAWLKAAFGEYYQQNAPVFHIALHSPCMTDEYFISHMDAFLQFIAGHKNVNFAFVSEITEAPKEPIRHNMLAYLPAVNMTAIKTFLTRP